jgi:8-oxo-dGTP pyrophosphatase MutT (NUDIX family)
MAKRKMSSSAVVLNRRGEVLLVKQAQEDRGWELPGGHVRKKEGSVEALVREVREETGLQIEPVQLIGVFHIPEERFTDFIFLCRHGGKKPPEPGSDEVIDCRFFPPGELPRPMSGYVRRRIADGLARRVQALPQIIELSQWLGKGAR